MASPSRELSLGQRSGMSLATWFSLAFALRRSCPPVAGSGVELEPGDQRLAGPVGVDLPQRVLVAPLRLEQDPPAIRRVRPAAEIDLDPLEVRQKTQAGPVGTDRGQVGGFRLRLTGRPRVVAEGDPRAVRSPVTAASADIEVEWNDGVEVGSVHSDRIEGLHVLVDTVDDAEFLLHQEQDRPAVRRDLGLLLVQARSAQNKAAVLTLEVHAPENHGALVAVMREHDPLAVGYERRGHLATLSASGKVADVAAVGVHDLD